MKISEMKKLVKKVMERFKLFLCKKSGGFFAYTEGVKKILMNNNIEEKNITVLNNTIDIMSHRKKFLSTKNEIQNKHNSHNSCKFEQIRSHNLQKSEHHNRS